MQLFAAHVDRLSAADCAAIRGAIPEETWEAIERAGLLGWLPIDVNLACTRAVAERLGPKKTDEFFRTLLLNTAQSPLLSGLIQSVLRIAVQDPGLYLPWISKGFELMFRDAGRWTVLERTPAFSLVEVRGLPEACLADAIWIQSVVSALSALLDVARLEGSVKLREVDASASRVVYSFELGDRSKRR
jgi:hypothetical protein